LAESIDSSMSLYGEVVSLGGIRHRPGAIAPMRKLNISAVVTATLTVLEANPARLWARITNNDDSNQIVVYFGSTWGYYEEVVGPHGSIQIDEHTPWTGPVLVDAVTATCVVIAHEVSVSR